MAEDEADQQERQRRAVAILLSPVPRLAEDAARETGWIEDRREPDPHGLY